MVPQTLMEVVPDDEVVQQSSVRAPVTVGVIGGVIGAVCCIGPAVGVAMGASAGSFLLGLGRYRPITFAIGALLAGLTTWLLLRGRRASCPSDQSFRAVRSRWLDVTLLAFAVTYGVGRFFVPRLIERR